MTREIKFGLLLVLGLTTVFSVMVYKRMHAPADVSAGTTAALDDNRESADDSSTPPLTIDGNTTPEVVTADGSSDAAPEEAEAIGAAESKPASQPLKPASAVEDPFDFPAAQSSTPVATPVAADDPFSVAVQPNPVKAGPLKSSPPVAVPQDDPFAPAVVRPAPVTTVRPQLTPAPVGSTALPDDDADPFGPQLAMPKPAAPKSAGSQTRPLPEADDPFTTPELTLPGRKEATAASTTVIERRPAMPVELDLGGMRVRSSGSPPNLMPSGSRYVIEPSDNYWTISRKVYGTGRYFQALLKHNETIVPDPQKMRPGLEIVTPPVAELEARYPELIPDQESKPSLAVGVVGSPGAYISEPGDNFWAISKKVYGSGRYFQALAEHNQETVPDPLKLKAGTVLQTPPASELQQRFAALVSVTEAEGLLPADRSSNDSEPPGFFVNADDEPRYRVGPDDTLSGIARAHLGRSSRWVQILEMNRDVLKDGNTLSVGTVLRLPHDASQVQAVGFDRGSR